MILLSFVIPCYRSEKTLETVVDELLHTVTQRPEYDYEIILVNDGSPDGVQAVIERLCDSNSHIYGLELARNFGQPNAQLAGFRFSKGDILISLDDDGQTPICEAFTLIDKIEEGYDAVYADYTDTRRDSSFRRMSSKINQSLAHKTYKQPKSVHTSSFYAIKRYLVEEIIRYPNPYPSNGAFVFLSTSHVVSVPMPHRKRLSGSSGYSFRRLFGLWSHSLFNFSLIPLRFSLALGLLCALISFIYALSIFIRQLFFGISVSGWASSIIITMLIGGIILFMLGILGEYIGRTFMSANQLPQYVVRSVHHNSEKEQEDKQKQ